MRNALLGLGILSLIISCNKSSTISSSLGLKLGNMITDKSGECSTVKCQKLRKEFDYVIYTGKKIYCYWDLKKETTKTDFDLIAKDLKSSITDTTSIYDYYLILRKWAGSLQDGHVNAIWGTNNEALEEMVVPLRLELIAPGTDHEILIISKTSTGFKNFPVGAIVTKINGVEAIERLNAIEKYMSGSTSRMRRSQAARFLFSIMPTRKEEKSAVKIEYTFDGKTVTADSPRLVTLPLVNKESAVDTTIDLNTLVQVQVLPNNIGYLRIDGFQGGKEMSKLLERTMKILEGSAAIIIDVRQNGGGDLSGNAIIAHLIEQKVSRYHSNYRISDLLLQDREKNFLSFDFNEGDAFTPFMNNSVEVSAPRYTGKVYVMTSPKCFSACDTFVSALKENKLATVVGEGTGGGTGTPYVFELDYSGLSFRYSVAQGLTAVHKEFLEGKGTLPDVEIFPTVEERIKDVDQQLLEAVNLVAKNIGLETVDKSAVENLKTETTYKETDAYTMSDESRQLKKMQLIDESALDLNH